MARNSGIKYTCPNINRAIVMLKDIISDIKYYESIYKNLDSVEDLDSSIETRSINVIDILEELRDSNNTLRSFGEEMAEETEKLEYKIEDLENKIEQLENENN